MPGRCDNSAEIAVREQLLRLFNKNLIVGTEQANIQIIIPRNEARVFNCPQGTSANEIVVDVQLAAYCIYRLEYFEFYLL